MDSIPKNMTLLALMTVFCLHVLAAPVAGAEISSQPAQGFTDPRFNKPFPGKQTEKMREEGAAKAQRAESRTRQKNNSATGDAFRFAEERQRDDNAPRGFQRSNREKSRESAPDTRDGKRGEDRTQRGNTFNGLGSITPPEELMRLNPQEKSRTQSAPREKNDDNAHQRGTTKPFRLGDGKNSRDDHSRRKSDSDYRRDKSRSYDDHRKDSRSDDHRYKNRSYDDHRDKRRAYDDHRREYRSDDYRGGYRYPDSYHRPQPDYRHYDRDHYRPRPVKHVVHYIPSRHAVILHGHERYHYYSGRYYRPWNSGFILVRPPLGLIVMSLPIGHRVFISAGIPYFVFGDVYYRQVPTGYQVVEPIRDPVVNLPERVSVNIDLLNVRYGPDKTEEVIAQVERYTRLRVIGSAPGWLYVEIEGQEDLRGWVMEEYVSAEPYAG